MGPYQYNQQASNEHTSCLSAYDSLEPGPTGQIIIIFHALGRWTLFIDREYQQCLACRYALPFLFLNCKLQCLLIFVESYPHPPEEIITDDRCRPLPNRAKLHFYIDGEGMPWNVVKQ